MPIITYEAGPLETEKKSELIKRITEVTSEITSIPEESIIVLIRELPFESIGVGGKTLESLNKEMSSNK